jgi:hypothetical protein
MRSLTDHGIVYYHCRRDVAERCPAEPAREDVLVAWATCLFDRVGALQPEAVAGAVGDARSRRASQVGSVAQVEASLARLEKLFVWGHVNEQEYLGRRKQLVDLRTELQAASGAAALPGPVEGVGKAWRLADPGRRRQLLGTFFEKLYIREGDVSKYVPRREYRDEVEALITLAVVDGLEYDRPLTGRGANLTRAGRRQRTVSSFGGKGGIRTLEGASNPLPA